MLKDTLKKLKVADPTRVEEYVGSVKILDIT